MLNGYPRSPQGLFRVRLPPLLFQGLFGFLQNFRCGVCGVWGQNMSPMLSWGQRLVSWCSKTTGCSLNGSWCLSHPEGVTNLRGVTKPPHFLVNSPMFGAGITTRDDLSINRQQILLSALLSSVLIDIPVIPFFMSKSHFDE